MTFGLDSTGFTKKKLSDIKTEIEADLTESLGPIDTSPESVFGQVIGVFADRESSIWDLAEQSYLAKYLTSAEGAQLDAVASILGITRQGATASTAFLMLFGTPATVIPEGSLFEQSGTTQQFELDNGGTDSIIDIANSAGVVFSVVNVLDSQAYSFTLNDGSAVPYSYNSGSGATASTILQGLANQVQSISPGEYNTSVVNDTLIVQRNDSQDSLQTTFTIDAITADLQIDVYGTEGNVKALTLGSVAVPSHSIDSIVTGVSGLDSVDNAVNGSVGIETETDVEFRTRIQSSTQIAGAATVPAIEARLVDDLAFISAAIILENRTSLVDLNGLPPHSFESILSSSDESATAKDLIASELFAIKPAGIQTFGNQSGDHVDSQGNPQTMFFSFTETVYLYLDIRYTLYSEELFPADGEARIATAVAEAGNDAAEAGIDVIIQRLFAAVFSVPGVKSVDMFNTAARLAVSGGPNGSGQPSDIGIVSAGAVDSVAANKLNNSLGVFIFDGVERMMWSKNSTQDTYALINGPTATPSDIPVNSDVSLDLQENIFGIVGNSYELGDWAENTDLPINARQIAIFNSDRINVAETP